MNPQKQALAEKMRQWRHAMGATGHRPIAYNQPTPVAQPSLVMPASVSMAAAQTTWGNAPADRIVGEKDEYVDWELFMQRI